ncbi:efflux RND transporter periplasmic adaptor subunit [Botrimarina sp.]|uniref:efflux RND transporter periplasmic adaptor subunit n=1 Tax=Botrimarina sp. TaxID=2795802 RepID=UPI0032EECD3F
MTSPIALRSTAVFAATLLVHSAAAQPPGGGAPSVVVAPAIEQSVAATQTFVGTVQPVRRATIGSAVNGRVVEFPIEEGDRVEAKQTLAQLLTETIELELAAAEAELELRRQRLAELRNGSRPEEIEQARARMAAADARREFAEARRQRADAVYRQERIISEDERDEAVALSIEAQEAYLETKAAYALAVAGPRVETIAQAEAELAGQEAVVQRLRDQISKHTIIARFAGYVVAEHTEEGEWVNSGDPVAEVVAIDEVEVVAQVTEGNVPFLRPGAEALVRLAALGQRTLTGEVAVTIPQADSRSRTFPVKVRVKNEFVDSRPVLLPGMLARVTLPVGVQQRAVLVPKDAVVLGGSSPVVFVVGGVRAEGDQGEARLAPVELGAASGSRIAVTGQLAAGEMVVTEGNERLRPGQAVRVLRVDDKPAPQAAAPGRQAATPSEPNAR